MVEASHPNLEAMLASMPEADSDSSDADQAMNPKSISSYGKASKRKKNSITTWTNKDEDDAFQPSAVIYLGHLPVGFEERELTAFLKQFGRVRRCRLSRSKKTGRSRGYAFVEFADAQVAKIVADAMSGYFLLEKRLVCEVVPKDRVHQLMFMQPKKRITKKSVLNKVRLEVNKRRTPEAIRKITVRLIQREKQKREKLAEMGIDYDFPGYAASASNSKIDDENEKMKLLDGPTNDETTIDDELETNTSMNFPIKKKDSLKNDRHANKRAKKDGLKLNAENEISSDLQTKKEKETLIDKKHTGVTLSRKSKDGHKDTESLRSKEDKYAEGQRDENESGSKSSAGRKEGNDIVRNEKHKKLRMIPNHQGMHAEDLSLEKELIESSSHSKMFKKDKETSAAKNQNTTLSTPSKNNNSTSKHNEPFMKDIRKDSVEKRKHYSKLSELEDRSSEVLVDEIMKEISMTPSLKKKDVAKSDSHVTAEVMKQKKFNEIQSSADFKAPNMGKKKHESVLKKNQSSESTTPSHSKKEVSQDRKSLKKESKNVVNHQSHLDAKSSEKGKRSIETNVDNTEKKLLDVAKSKTVSKNQVIIDEAVQKGQSGANSKSKHGNMEKATFVKSAMTPKSKKMDTIVCDDSFEEAEIEISVKDKMMREVDSKPLKPSRNEEGIIIGGQDMSIIQTPAHKRKVSRGNNSTKDQSEAGSHTKKKIERTPSYDKKDCSKDSKDISSVKNVDLQCGTIKQKHHSEVDSKSSQKSPCDEESTRDIKEKKKELSSSQKKKSISQVNSSGKKEMQGKRNIMSQDGSDFKASKQSKRKNSFDKSTNGKSQKLKH